MANTLAEAVVRKSVRVRAPIERAFSVFVEQLETWWPATHHIGKVPFEAIFVETRVGGRWYERGAFSWHVGPGHDSPDWVCDPDQAKASEMEIRFTAEAPDPTLVELTHSRLERHGEGYEQLRVIYDGPGAWSGILGLYAKAADQKEPQ